MSTVTEVVEAALTLTEDDRSLLVEIVLSSLDAPDFDDSELEAELQRRMSDIEAGHARFLSLEEMDERLASVRERFAAPSH